MTRDELLKRQLIQENKYSKKEIRKLVTAEIRESSHVMGLLEDAVNLALEWKNSDEHWEGKKQRLANLDGDIITAVMVDILTEISTEERPRAITEVVPRCIAAFPEHMDYIAKINTVAELSRFMHDVELVDVYQAFCSPVYIKDTPVIAIQPKYILSERMCLYVSQTMHLPPLLVKPKPITKNSDSPYYVEKKPVVLKWYNQHEEELALDVINLQNENEYSLDIEFLKVAEEEYKPSKKTKDGEMLKKQKDMFIKFQEESYHVYLELAKYGNKFYLGHHFDARGRLYCKGYHVSSQGNAFKKAILNWSEEKEIQISDEERSFFE